jgi:DNA-binding NarL/FixJ family response regulator
MMIHGLLDHSARRFAIFQVCNPRGGELVETATLFCALVSEMAHAVWRILLSNRAGLNSRRGMVGHPTLSLTAAELHIVELLAQGLSNKEIARRRGVSDSTIKTQVQRTGSKVGATRRAEIVALALPFLSPLPPQSLIDYDDYEL